MSIQTAVAFRCSRTSQLRILVLLVLRDREASFSQFSPNFPPTPLRHSVKKSLYAFDRRPSSVRQQLTRKLTCIRGRSRSHRHCRAERVSARPRACVPSASVSSCFYPASDRLLRMCPNYLTLNHSGGKNSMDMIQIRKEFLES